MMDHVAALGTPLLAALQVALAAFASAHVMLRKRDVRAAIGWIGLVWLVPIGGAVLYALFGINRIRRRGSAMRASRTLARAGGRPAAATALVAVLPEDGRHLATVARLLDRVTGTALTAGNAIEPLEGGDAAYPAMLSAIDGSRRSVALLAYIFDDDEAGRDFVEALRAAVCRDVAVRVLIDSVGARYSRPPITARLRHAGVPSAEFLPTLLPWSLHYANLRNHRKILVADGRIGFTGGMNIRHGHREADAGERIEDVHFRLQGPVVGQLQETFAQDWAFTTGERLGGDAWFPALEPAGETLARGIAAGPDEAFERIRWAILGALAQAQQRVRIVTPYFLPDTVLATALQLCALRGVTVDLVLPAKGNLRLVQWASWAKIAQFVARGCRVWLTPPPFDHAKLMTVDGLWCLIGSANWDPRSLRLNFEFDVECYGAPLAAHLDALVDARIAAARPLPLADVESRPLPHKLRDSAAWLLSPYL